MIIQWLILLKLREDKNMEEKVKEESFKAMIDEIRRKIICNEIPKDKIHLIDGFDSHFDQPLEKISNRNFHMLEWENEHLYILKDNPTTVAYRHNNTSHFFDNCPNNYTYYKEKIESILEKISKADLKGLIEDSPSYFQLQDFFDIITEILVEK